MQTDLWQLQNALATAARNLEDGVTLGEWPAWIVAFLARLDDWCLENDHNGEVWLTDVQDRITERLVAGRW